MLVDGKTLAAEIIATLKNELTHTSLTPHLTIVTCAPDAATTRYLTLKLRRAAEVGIATNVIELPALTTTEELIAVLKRAGALTDGIIVQLPLPPTIDTEQVLAAINPSTDVDGVFYARTGAGFLPPVVAAIHEIALRHSVLFNGQRVAVVGHGRLVGQPAAVFAQAQGASVTVVTKEAGNLESAVAAADILILGAGVPGLITPTMVREGVVIFDAATAEDNGVLRGDADPACAAKAALLTPVPGGIGPLTVAVLLRNVFLAAQ